MVKHKTLKKQKKQNNIIKRKNKTQNYRPNNQNKSHIVKIFIELLVLEKKYHNLQVYLILYLQVCFLKIPQHS